MNYCPTLTTNQSRSERIAHYTYLKGLFTLDETVAFMDEALSNEHDEAWLDIMEIHMEEKPLSLYVSSRTQQIPIWQFLLEAADHDIWKIALDEAKTQIIWKATWENAIEAVRELDASLTRSVATALLIEAEYDLAASEAACC